MSVIYDMVHLTGGIEATFGSGMPSAPNRVPLEVGEVGLNPNITRVQRNIHRPGMSPAPNRIGQIIQGITFNAEVRGSGVTDGSRPPNVDVLLRACGFARTAVAAPGLVKAWASPENKRTAAVTFASAAYAGTVPRLVSVTMTSPTVATVVAHETPNGQPEVRNNSVAIASGTSFAGPNSATLTMTFTGALQLGDVYFFWLAPRGHLYTPITDPESAESLSIWAILSNKRHEMDATYGTVSLSATAGEIANFAFQFTGKWKDPVDVAFPTDVDLTAFGPVPPVVELADLSLNNNLVSCPTTFGFDMANTINNVPCANALAGNAGASLSTRTPTASFNMDSVPVAAMNIWSMMRAGSRLMLHWYIGSVPGNIVQFIVNGQISNTQYAELNTLRKNDNTMDLSAVTGGDEVMIFFG